MFRLQSRAYAPLPLSTKLLQVPWSLIAVALAIAGFGVLALYSVAGGDFSPWANRHALRLLVGSILVVALALTPSRFWLSMAIPLYAVAFTLLVLVPLIGTQTMGARRWLGSEQWSLQPSEIMKIALVLVLARYYQAIAFERRSHPIFVAVPLLLIVVPAAFIMKQPDLGSATLLTALGLAIMFFAGVHWLYFAGGFAILGGLGELIWQRMHDYQRARVLTFLNPDRDPLGAGYHISQSKIALGSGGLSGKGLMNGSQSQLNFLPEKHTDFIFTMFAEEMGFVGSMTLLGLYMMMLGILLIMAFRVRCQFARILIAGAALLIAIHVTINVGMVVGLVPVVGVPLPLVSYGGTSMLTIMFALGLAASAYVHRGDVIRRDEVGVLV